MTCIIILVYIWSDLLMRLKRGLSPMSQYSSRLGTFPSASFHSTLGILLPQCDGANSRPRSRKAKMQPTRGLPAQMIPLITAKNPRLQQLTPCRTPKRQLASHKTQRPCHRSSSRSSEWSNERRKSSRIYFASSKDQIPCQSRGQ